MTDLDRLLELAKKATPGPWDGVGKDHVVGRFIIWRSNYNDPSDTRIIGTDIAEADAEFIAACSPDTIIGLIERVKEAERIIQYIRGERDGARANAKAWKLERDAMTERAETAEAEVLSLRKTQGKEWAYGERVETLEARLRAAEDALTDIASWDEEKGHDGHHHGPCMGCQRVFTARKALRSHDEAAQKRGSAPEKGEK